MRIWAAFNSADCDRIERAKMAQMATDIVPTFLVFPCFRDAKELIKLLADGWQLDHGRQRSEACSLYARRIC